MSAVAAPAGPRFAPPFVARRIAPRRLRGPGGHRPRGRKAGRTRASSSPATAWWWWTRWRARARARQLLRTIRGVTHPAGRVAGAHPPSSRPPLRRHRVPAGGSQGHRAPRHARARQRGRARTRWWRTGCGSWGSTPCADSSSPTCPIGRSRRADTLRLGGRTIVITHPGAGHSAGRPHGLAAEGAGALRRRPADRGRRDDGGGRQRAGAAAKPGHGSTACGRGSPCPGHGAIPAQPGGARRADPGLHRGPRGRHARGGGAGRADAAGARDAAARRTRTVRSRSIRAGAGTPRGSTWRRSAHTWDWRTRCREAGSRRRLGAVSALAASALARAMRGHRRFAPPVRRRRRAPALVIDRRAGRAGRRRGPVVVIDVRTDVFAYLKGHLPGRGVPQHRDARAPARGHSDPAPLGRRLPRAVLAAGRRSGRPVVIYSAGETRNIDATFLAWLLAGFGHPQVFVLDGGFFKWQLEQRPVVQPYPRIPVTRFPGAPFRPEAASLEDVQRAIGDGSDAGGRAPARPVRGRGGRADAPGATFRARSTTTGRTI